MCYKSSMGFRNPSSRKFNSRPVAAPRRKIYELTVRLPLPRRRIDGTSFVPSVFDTRWSTQSIPGWNSRTGSRSFRPVDNDKAERREEETAEDQATDLSLDLSSRRSLQEEVTQLLQRENVA